MKYMNILTSVCVNAVSMLQWCQQLSVVSVYVISCQCVIGVRCQYVAVVSAVSLYVSVVSRCQ